MKRVLLFIIFHLFISSILFCQTSFDWVFQAGNSNGVTIPTSIDVGNDNFVYSTGYFSNALSFEKQTISVDGTGNYAYLTKHDKTKKLLWFKTFGDANGTTQSTSVSTDILGNVYVSGVFSQNIIIEGYEYNTNSNKASFVVKYTSDGVQSWVRVFESTDEINIMSICTTPFGDVYFGGFSKGDVDLGVSQFTSNEPKAFVAKMNISGEVQWVLTSINSLASTSSITKLAADETGDVYAVGTFSGIINFDNNTLTSNSNNSFIVKMKSTGTYDWCIHVAGSSDDSLNDIDTHNGFVGVFGNINSPDIEIKGKSNVSLETNGNEKVLAIALTSDGEYLWNYVIGDGINASYGNGISIDNQNNYYLSGSCSGTVNFNPNDQNNPITPTAKGGLDMYVAKLDAQGKTMYANRFGGGTTEQVLDIALSNDNSTLFIASEFKRRNAGSSSYTKTNFAMQGDIFELAVVGAASNTAIVTYTLPLITTQTINVLEDENVKECISQVGGGIASFSLIDGVLPNGINLTSKGYFEGIPSETGTYNFKVSLTLTENGYNKIYENITLIVNPSSTPVIEIKENNNDVGINIYPNPNKGVFMIDIANKPQYQPFTIEIYDITGRLGFKQETLISKNQITLTNLAKGFYLVKISNAYNTITTSSFLIE